MAALKGLIATALIVAAAYSFTSFEVFAWVTLMIVLVIAAIPSRRKRRLARSWFGRSRPSVLGASSNHGNARWAHQRELRRLFPGPSGVVVGEAMDLSGQSGDFNPEDRSTWGNGGTAPLLIDPCKRGSTHSMIFCGSGWFKTTSTAIPSMLCWKDGSSVMIDPSCEVAPMISGILEAEHGKRVFLLDPVRPAGARRWGFDVFDWINPEADRFAAMHVASICASLFSDPPVREDPQAAFWREWGRELTTALAIDLLWTDDAEGPRTLNGVKARLATPEAQMRDFLKFINANSKSRVAASIAGQLMGLVDETFSGVYATANQQTSWLNYREFGDLVSGDAFRTRDLLDGRTTIFVQIPADVLRVRPGLGRVILTSLMNAVRQAKGNFPGRVLFELDEVAHLGKLAAIQDALTADRKFGITMQLLYQDIGQLEQQWDASGRDTFLNAMNWVGYASVFDLKTAKMLSEWCGNRSVLAYSESDTKGTQTPPGMRGFFRSRSNSLSRNVHEIRAPLIRPEAILQETRADEMFVTARGHHPARVSRAMYFRRKDLAEKVLASQYYRAA
jgi:type IV secretion system protein VirD4